MITNECIVSSTGFVNYFQSSERTAREVKNAYDTYGDDIIIINGADDWYADCIFKPVQILHKLNIPVIGSFHDGCSGITKSGAIINKADLPKFLEFVKNNSPHFRENSRGIRYSLQWYDKDAEKWVVLVKQHWDEI